MKKLMALSLALLNPEVNFWTASGRICGMYMVMP